MPDKLENTTPESSLPQGHSEGSADDQPRRCRGTNNDGSACGAPPQWIAESGYCLQHDPDREAERAANRQLGGLRTASKKRAGLRPDQLPSLNSPEDVMKWTAVLARAVATGELPSAQARTALVAVQAWLKAHDQQVLQRRLDELEHRLKGRPRVVK